MFKIICLILGVFIGGGFWGGLIGLIIGGMIDRIPAANVFSPRSSQQLSPDEFIKNILIFTAAVVKSDNGQMLRSELDFVRNYLTNRIGTAKTQGALLILRDILDKDYDIEAISRELASNASVHEKLLILQFLFGLASSDGNVSNEEMNTIQNISAWMGLPHSTFESLKAMFFNAYRYRHQHQYQYQNSSRPSTSYYNIENDYKILEIASTATDDEVKKAYRKLAMKHHPDKVNHLGDDIRKTAEEKFVLLNESYERIKKSRGMN